jgi:hypothetical protein
LTDDYAVTARPFNCNVGLYSPAGGKNELEKKINIARDESQKKIIGEKTKPAYIAGVKTIVLMRMSINLYFQTIFFLAKPGIG